MNKLEKVAWVWSKNEWVVHSKVILVPQKMLSKTFNLKMTVKLPAEGAIKFLEKHLWITSFFVKQ